MHASKGQPASAMHFWALHDVLFNVS